MSRAAADVRNSRAARQYMMICFGGLLALVPALLLKGLDLWSIAPLLVGAVALVAHWRAGPVFVLVTLAVVLVIRSRGYDPITCVQLLLTYNPPRVLDTTGWLPPTPFADLVVCAALLAYCVGQYRLQALVHGIVPPEPRGPRPTGRTKIKDLQPPPDPRRAPGLVTRWELPLLLAALPACAGAAAVAWLWLSSLTPGLDMSPTGWRALVFLWLTAVALLLAWGLLGYLTRATAGEAESLMFLQDLAWRKTRREQNSLNRWLAWARLRTQRREEKS